jgi:alpha-1,3-rhamnosyl/mannosyltransferase
VDPAFVPSSPEAVRATLRRFGIGDWPYALFVGGVEPRKNLLALVRAFSQLRDPDVRLVLAGGRVRWAPGEWDAVEDAIGGLGRSAWTRIVRTGYVNEHDRRALMSGATVLAYPSRYEGFGFPVLEGFASGVPVLTSDTSSLPEVAGDAALLVDPSDEDAIAEGLARLFGDAELRSRLADAGLERVQAYTWERCAASTAETLRRASAR